VRLATEAGASYVTGIALHLRRGVREVFMAWLAQNRPDLVERYEELYRRRAYAPPAERARLARLLDRAQLEAPAREPVDWRRANGGGERRKSGETSSGRESAAPLAAEPRPRSEPPPRLF